MDKDNQINSNKTTSIDITKPGYQNARFINKLSHAILHDELRLHYQPRYNAATGKVDVLEAFVRWSLPNEDLLYPDVFITQAEKNGLIFNLDLWVFEQCCKDLLWLHENIHSQLKICINISVQECEDVSYLQKIIKLSDLHRVHISNFEFDITACAHTHDIEKVTSFCEALKNYDVKFSLDDFATGPSPMVKLWRLTNTIIINKNFIHGIGTSINSEACIRSLVKMAKDIRVHIIAEGIESNEQCDFMSDLGCDQLQGFLLCKPLKISQINPSILHEQTNTMALNMV
jgi:EAL domain-containing protein (putative c-di-GMP-specific phosphodiesterase class I)